MKSEVIKRVGKCNPVKVYKDRLLVLYTQIEQYFVPNDNKKT
jgi:hypothetical protein